VFRTIHVTTLHGILVSVVKLLAHHSFAADQFCMRALLPELIFPIRFVRELACVETFQQISDVWLYAPG